VISSICDGLVLCADLSLLPFGLETYVQLPNCLGLWCRTEDALGAHDCAEQAVLVSNTLDPL